MPPFVPVRFDVPSRGSVFSSGENFRKNQISLGLKWDTDADGAGELALKEIVGRARNDRGQ